MHYTAKTAYHGKVASQYDEDRQAEPIWAVEQEFVRHWCESLPAAARLLDVPCGTGRFLAFFLERRLRVQACDISADMVAELRRRYPGAPVEAGVADAEHLPFPDDSFDALVSWRFVHLVPGPVLVRALREFRRVTRGPILVEVLQVAPAGRRRWRAARDWLRPWYHRWLALAGNQPWSHITSYSHDEDSLKRHFARAGLRIDSRHELGFSAERPVIVYQLRREQPGA